MSQLIKSESLSLSSEREVVLSCSGLQRYLGSGGGRVHVLHGVALEVEFGQVNAVVGPSGCGKSTLLYLLGLLDRPDGGEIWINGKEVATASDEVRTAVRCTEIGFVFQFHFLLPEFSAIENVMLPARKLGRLLPEEMRETAHELLKSVGLGEKTHRLPSQLSGGEQQRVAIARSLMNSPSIILADEPTGNLDVTNSNLVFDLLMHLAKEKGQAVVLVTHNSDIADRCDRILQMRDGSFL